MPSNRKKARRAIRAFLKNLSEKNPDTPTDQQGVWACGAALYSEDLRVLLDSERTARAQAKAQRDAAAVQSGKAAEAAAVVARLQEQNTTLRKSLADAGQDEVLYPNTIRALQNTVRVLRAENTDLRNNVSELSSKISDPPGSHERWQELRQRNTSLAAQRDAAEAALTACRAANTQSLRERDEARAARRAADSYKEALEKALRATRAELDALRGVRTAENLRSKNGHWSTDYFVTVMEELVKELKK